MLKVNAKKAKGLEETDDRDHVKNDIFNCIVNEDPIFYENLDTFIRIFSELTELN